MRIIRRLVKKCGGIPMFCFSMSRTEPESQAPAAPRARCSRRARKSSGSRAQERSRGAG